MDASLLFSEIRDFCLSNANVEVAKSSQRFFKEHYDGYGLTAPQVHQKVKELLHKKELNQSIILSAMPMFLENGKYEEISLGLLLLNGFSKQFTRETFNEISTYFSKSIDNWAHADILGMFILPKFLLQNIVGLNDFDTWISSPYKFQRRCVPVTFIKPVKVKKEVSTYIDFVKTLMDDKEREVHQGMGWFLREAWKIEHKEVETFLFDRKETAPRLIVQYACEKMSAEEKKRFKRTDQKR